MRTGKFRKWISRILCACLIAGIGVAFVPCRNVEADAVTDTLTVAVGYWGMDLADYAIAGTYFWGDLEAELPMYEQAYTYFQSNSATEYVAIVDSAYGFLVRDLLDYANINFGDIYNLQFYVVDHNGIQAAFDTGSLFAPRYYFDNVALHRKVHYRTYETVETVEVYETVTVTEMVDVTETVIVTEMRDVYETVEIIETVPVLDEEGNPVLDEDGNPMTEERVTYDMVPFLNEDGSIKQEEVPVYNEDGSVMTMEVPVYNEDGSIKQEEVPVYNSDGTIKTEQVPVYNPDGSIKTETVTVTKTDYNTVTGYSFDECWNYCERVEPMLALFDSWIGYSQEFESIGPNFEVMSANNRFRLLFGQTSPTETLTSASAKYVSRVYVTLYGSPVIGEIPELDNTLGSHEVTVQVKVDDVSLINALSEYMRINSTDESVMRVTGLDFSGVEGYSDLMNVRIRYEIVGNGTASLTASFGGKTESINMTQQVEVTETGSGSGSQTDGETETPSSEGNSQPEQDDKEGSAGDSASPAANANGSKNSPGSTEHNSMTAPDTDRADTVTDSEEYIPELPDNGLKNAEELLDDPAELAQEMAPAGFLLSDLKAGRINEMLIDHQTEEQYAEAKDITQVKLEDSSDKKEEEQKLILMWTGIASAFICLAGASAEIITFKRRLSRG